MHVCPLRFYDWQPKSDYEFWVSDVVARNPVLRKCALACTQVLTPGVALSLAGVDVYVHIESTICEHCGANAGLCAVPDFGSGNAEYRAFVFQQPREVCPTCGKRLDRRVVLRRLA